MFGVIYPNRWLIWAIVISVVTAMLLYWAIALYMIELRWDPASNGISDALRNFKKMRLEQGDISGWKTYRNQKLGITFQYPSRWGELVVEEGCLGNNKCMHAMLKAQSEIFLVVQNQYYKDNGDGRGAYFGDFPRDIRSPDWVKKYCDGVNKASCELEKNSNGIEYARSHEPIQLLDAAEGEFANYYYLRYPDIGQAAIVISDERLPFSAHSSGELQVLVDTLQFFNPIDISTWKTYRNEKYGFEFKYPESWSLTQSAGWSVQISQPSKYGDNVDFYCRDKGFPCSFPDKTIIGIGAGRDKGATFQDILKKYLYSRLIVSAKHEEKEIIIDGHNAIRAIISIPATESVFIDGRNGRFLEISAGYGPESEEKVLKTFDEMLSTIHLFDPIDTSTWKTYRNEKYGFEFKYPVNWSATTSKYYLVEAWGDNTIFSVNGIEKATREEFIERELSRIELERISPHCTECGYGGPPTNPTPINFRGFDATNQRQEDDLAVGFTISIPQKGVQIRYSYSNYEGETILVKAIIETFKFIEPSR